MIRYWAIFIILSAFSANNLYFSQANSNSLIVQQSVQLLSPKMFNKLGLNYLHPNTLFPYLLLIIIIFYALNSDVESNLSMGSMFMTKVGYLQYSKHIFITTLSTLGKLFLVLNASIYTIQAYLVIAKDKELSLQAIIELEANIVHLFLVIFVIIGLGNSILFALKSSERIVLYIIICLLLIIVDHKQYTNFICYSHNVEQLIVSILSLCIMSLASLFVFYFRLKAKKEKL